MQPRLPRYDRKGDIFRIVDYKTGSKKEYPKNLDDLFDPGKDQGHALQIFYYAAMVCHQPQFKDKKVAPTLLYTRSTSKPSQDDLYYKLGDHPVLDFAQFAPQFEEKLAGAVRNIFDPSQPFARTEDEKACTWCDFYRLCHPGQDPDNNF